MNIVRCAHCGEITDLARSQTCTGCGEPLPAEPAGKRPRQISPVTREASADLDFAQGMLTVIVGSAAIGVALYFLKDSDFMGVVVTIGLAAAILYPILRWMRRKGKDPKAGPRPVAVPRVRSAALARPSGSAYVGSAESLGSSFEQGCGMFLKAIGIFIAVVVGLILLGILILWIACMSSSFGHF